MDKNISGAISGALDPDSEEADQHAEQYYESVRKMKDDYIDISKNTGISEKDILAIKNYLFVDKHEFLENERFYHNYYISQSWQRLISGKNIKKQDMIMINHELMEIDLLNKGMTQNEAHILASKKYNYKEASDRGI